ncbi:dienelactone hydrolase family protein [Aquimarina sp. Aq78]|uniref:alpha/beta hydrolase family protein n=1 Tax=Aquimarina sp. Aq78 TaxID=1191889 RepID=UPI000D0EA267|nr:dienelactone hydrolase family protein [Aquimarina sp. Aq78]
MKNTLIILTAITLFLSCAQQKEKTFRIGQKSVTFVDESRNRPLLTEIWYPTLDNLTKKESKENQKELFKTIETIPNATIPNEKFPLILISHGTGGNRFSLTWFIEKMVKEGYVVVSLDHYGNSTFNKIPREFVKWWERAIDVQYVLTNILNNTEIGTKIDTSRIGGVGFSLGGYTNIALAGGYVDRTIRENEKPEGREMPAEFPKTDEIIDFENDSLIVSSYNKYKDHVKDDRIKAFFVMAPAIGFGFHAKEQTSKITAPVFIVAGKGDTNTPIKNNAENYHHLIKTSQIHLFDKNVGHYVFLNEPTEFGKEVAPNITIDKPTVDRKEIHEKTLRLALDFFKKTL